MMTIILLQNAAQLELSNKQKGNIVNKRYQMQKHSTIVSVETMQHDLHQRKQASINVAKTMIYKMRKKFCML